MKGHVFKRIFVDTYEKKNSGLWITWNEVAFPEWNATCTKEHDFRYALFFMFPLEQQPMPPYSSPVPHSTGN